MLFLGRYDEPRKGMSVLLDALPRVVERFADVQLLIVGRGDEDELRRQAGGLAQHMRFLGQVDDAAKASAMRSADVYCAPNIGGESFGIVLVEAMAAGTPVVASDLDAFRRVLRDGEVGRLVPVDPRVTAAALADALVEVLAERRVARTLCGGRLGGGPPLRLVRGGQPDHAGLRDGRRVGRQGPGGQLMTWPIVAVLILVALVATAGGAWAYRIANRLDRLHVRYDLSWQALDGALARRAVVARAVAIDAYGAASKARQGGRLAALADAAEGAPRHARENAENELSAALAMVDPASLPTGLIAELADAEARVLLARRFHNDAVRDTLALRERFLVRALRLGGTAALPSYFEIVERPHALRARRPGFCSTTAPRRGWSCSTTPARCCCCAGQIRQSRTTPRRGGGSPWAGEVRHGERLAEAAARELAEETGLRVASADMIGPVWRRDEVFEFNGALIDSEEFYLVFRTRRFEPSIAGRTELEHRYIHGPAGVTSNDIAELTAAGEQVYPLQLGELLPAANRLADDALDNEAAAGVPQPIR